MKSGQNMKNRKNWAGHIVLYAFLVFLAAICIVPFYTMMINATRSNAEISVTLSLLPGKSLVNNYMHLNETINMLGALKNSLVIAVLSTALTGYFGAMAAYGFSKFRFKGRNALFVLALSTMMIPFQLCYIGLFQASARLHLINTFWPIILPAIANATTVFWMRNHMSSVIDDAYIEAARVDGFSEMSIFHTLILPLSQNGLFTVSIFNFVYAWNDYIAPLIFLSKNEKFPLSLAIAIVKQADFQDQGAIYAGVAMSIIPILVVYLFLNSKIISGLTVGGVKG